MDVVCRNKMIKKKISSTWVKTFQFLPAVLTPEPFILCVWAQFLTFSSYQSQNDSVFLIYKYLQMCRLKKS